MDEFIDPTASRVHKGMKKNILMGILLCFCILVLLLGVQYLLQRSSDSLRSHRMLSAIFPSATGTIQSPTKSPLETCTISPKTNALVETNTSFTNSIQGR